LAVIEEDYQQFTKQMQDDLAKKDQEIAKITVNNEKRLKAEKQELQMMLEKAEQDVL